jgi:hypothetical protein
LTNWSIKTTTYTASAGDQILASTSSGAWTLTLPASPSAGNVVRISDGNDWSVNNLTIARNGSTIEGVADNFVLDIKGIEVNFIYSGTTWEVFATCGTAGPQGLRGPQGAQGAIGPQGPTNIIDVSDDVTSTTLYPVMVGGTGPQGAKISTTKLTFNASTGTITAVDFNSTSDANLKTSVEPLQNSIEILNQIIPVKFNWVDGGDQSYGVIAQELEKVLPELVKEVNGVKSVSYIPLIALLIDAVKTLQKEVDDLKNK